MKQITITIVTLFLFTTLIINAQETDEKTKKEKPKHEVGLDFLELIQYNKIELSYRYILNENNSFGLKAHLYPAESRYWENKNWNEQVGFDLNYQHYFSNNYAQGFYVEGFVKYGFGSTFQTFNNPPQHVSEEFQRLSFGLGIGYKYVFKNELYIDTKISISESVFTKGNSYNLVPNDGFDFSVTLGKRF